MEQLQSTVVPTTVAFNFKTIQRIRLKSRLTELLSVVPHTLYQEPKTYLNLRIEGTMWVTPYFLYNNINQSSIKIKNKFL